MAHSGPNPAYRTAPFAVLGHSIGMRVFDADLGAYLDRAFASLPRCGEPAAWWDVVDRGPAAPDPAARFALLRDGDPLSGCGSVGELVALVLYWVNRVVCFETDHRVMVHAAVAEQGGRALVLPAPQESGKSTLVAGLVAAGYGYLTDEAAAVRLGSGVVDAYPKWVSVDPGSWEVLADLRPPLPPAEAGFAAVQWHVDPSSIRAGAVAPTAEPGWVVAPRYRAGAATVLDAMSRAEALAALAREAFNLDRLGRDGFDALAALAGRSSCWRLTVGTLAEGVEAVRGLTG